MKKTVFVVDLATPQLAQAIHKAGYQAGALVLWHDRVTPSAWSIDAAGYDIQLRLDLKKNSLDEIEAALRKAAPDIVGIIPTNEPSEEAACRIAERFNLPHNSPDIAAIRWHKAKVKELAQQAGLRVPKFKACYSPEEVQEFSKSLSYPIIIKTPQGSASVNVFKCHNEKDLVEKHRAIITTPDDFGNQSNYSVIEEYIGGTEYQANTFSDGKKVHVTDVLQTEKIETEFAANLYYNDLLIDPRDSKIHDVVSYVEKVAEITGIKYGPGHIEVKVDGEGPALIEAHARFGGYNEPEMVQKFSNFDPFAAIVEAFTRGVVSIPEYIEFSTHVACASCPSTWSCQRGVVKGLDEIRKLSSYHSEHLGRGVVLEPVLPTTHLHNYPLFVWLVHRSQEQLSQDLKRVHKAFHIQCLPEKQII